MQSDQVKMRFGRCPYCRAMIYQDPNAIIYYCSKCRTPIRGKNPEPADDDEYALAQLEILSFDTMSTFSDETEPSSADVDPTSRDTGVASSSSAYRPYSAIRTGPRSGDLGRYDETEVRGSGSPMHSRVSELRPASRRTRRPASADLDAPRDQGSGAGGGEFDVPRIRSASSYDGRRASPLSSQELEAAVMDLSGEVRGNGPAAGGAARSPLGDPAFQKDLLQALENLRKLIVAVEEPLRVDAPRLAAGAPPTGAPCSNSAPHKVTRRDSRILRRLESQLAHALPEDKVRRQDKAASSSSLLPSVSGTPSASSSRRGASSRHLICRPILGGTPFIACDNCEEMLQLPTVLSVNRLARLQCGGCGEMLTVTLPARSGGSSTDRPRKIFSAPQPAGFGAHDAEEQHISARSRLSAEQVRQGPDEGPLHRVLGYSSVSSVLRSRRYDEQI